MPEFLHYLFNDKDDHSLAKHAQFFFFGQIWALRKPDPEDSHVGTDYTRLSLQKKEIILYEQNNSTLLSIDLKPLS